MYHSPAVRGECPRIPHLTSHEKFPVPPSFSPFSLLQPPSTVHNGLPLVLYFSAPCPRTVLYVINPSLPLRLAQGHCRDIVQILTDSQRAYIIRWENPPVLIAAWFRCTCFISITPVMERIMKIWSETNKKGRKSVLRGLNGLYVEP